MTYNYGEDDHLKALSIVLDGALYVIRFDGLNNYLHVLDAARGVLRAGNV